MNQKLKESIQILKECSLKLKAFFKKAFRLRSFLSWFGISGALMFTTIYHLVYEHFIVVIFLLTFSCIFISAMMSFKDKKFDTMLSEKDEKFNSMLSETDKKFNSMVAEKDEKLNSMLSQRDEKFNTMLSEKNKKNELLISQTEEQNKKIEALQNELSHYKKEALITPLDRFKKNHPNHVYMSHIWWDLDTLTPFCPINRCFNELDFQSHFSADHSYTQCSKCGNMISLYDDEHQGLPISFPKAKERAQTWRDQIKTHLVKEQAQT